MMIKIVGGILKSQLSVEQELETQTADRFAAHGGLIELLAIFT